MGSKSFPRIRIAVMGVTGTGKSTFIKMASNIQAVEIGHRYQSHTAEVAPFEFNLEGYEVTLIDSPGFNDTKRSEAQVLADIANYLDFTYRNPPHLKLTGIIYLQSIMDPRFYGSSVRNLRMFKDLCGEKPMKNVLLVTNRWQQASSIGERDQAEAKEEELRNSPDFWEPLIQRGAHMARWEDTAESALNIVRHFIGKAPEVLQIQTELVEQDKDLIDTKAGTTVNEEAIRLQKEYQGEIAKIRREMEEARMVADLEVQEALEQSKKDYERKLDKVRNEQELLHYERRNEARRMQNEMDDLRAAYNRKLEEQLGAQKIDFDKTVAQLLANQDKLRREQRAYMQAEIEAMKKKSKKERSGGKLLAALIPSMGSMVLGLIGLPSLFGGLGGGGS